LAPAVPALELPPTPLVPATLLPPPPDPLELVPAVPLPREPAEEGGSLAELPALALVLPADAIEPPELGAGPLPALGPRLPPAEAPPVAPPPPSNPASVDEQAAISSAMPVLPSARLINEERIFRFIKSFFL
jgi:hypothetical protein